MASGGLTTSGSPTFSGLTGAGTNYYVCTSAAGGLYAGTSCAGSSGRFKENITDLNLGLDEVMKLRPVTYNWREDYNSKDSDLQFGFIAEEARNVSELFVNYDSNGTLHGVNYAQLTALLAKGVQEQQGQIDKNTDEIEEVRQIVDNQNVDVEEIRKENEELKKQLEELKAEVEGIVSRGVSQDSFVSEKMQENSSKKTDENNFVKSLWAVLR